MKNDRRVLVFDWITTYIDDPDIVPISSFKDFFEGQASYALPKHSELIGLFNHHLGKLKEAGVMHNIRQRWFGAKLAMTKREQEEDESRGAEVLGYENVAFPFIAVFTGLGMAMILSLVEGTIQTVIKSIS